jgi:deoxyribodipyrimidine photo-lyase
MCLLKQSCIVFVSSFTNCFNMPTLFDNTESSTTSRFETDFSSILYRMERINPVQYAKTRNFINGAVTYLSPYISRGVITVGQVLQTVLQKGYKHYQIEKFIQELAWREYYQRVWLAKGDLIAQDLKQPQPDVLRHARIQSVEQAATGINAIDTQIKNLYSSGYMHNHVRMYVASIVCNIGKAHWLQPSQWLYYHLLDGDVASNNCSWQWVAAAFASKKYYCNQENINKYTFSNQQKTFLDISYDEIPSVPVPEVLKETTIFQLTTALPQTALPVIDTTKPVLVYNSYNLDPLWRKNEAANRILLLEPSHFKKHPVSKKVIDFIIGLSKNIDGMQLYCGELEDITALHSGDAIISKEHPAFDYYPGKKDSRDWMFPEVSGYHASFFSYWKKCEGYLKQFD